MKLTILPDFPVEILLTWAQGSELGGLTLAKMMNWILKGSRKAEKSKNGSSLPSVYFIN